MGYGRGGGGGENVENGVKKNGDIYSRAHADFVVLEEDGAPAKPPNSKKSEPPIDTSPPASLPVSRRPSSSGSLSRSQAFDQKSSHALSTAHSLRLATAAAPRSAGKAKTKAAEEHRRAETRRRWLHLKEMLVKHSISRADAKAKKEVHILSGLYQQHERHMVQDAALNLEKYSNRSMKLVAVLDSIPVNLVLVCNVIVDVACMLFFSLQFLVDNDDCFGRDVPLQHIIMLICLSIYTTELLLRGVGHGFRDHYGPHRRNIPNILDASVILVSAVLGIVKVVLDGNMTCHSTTPCTMPPTPYTEEMDKYQARESSGVQICPSAAIAAMKNVTTDQLHANISQQNTARTVATALRAFILTLRIMRGAKMLLKARHLAGSIYKRVARDSKLGSRRFEQEGFDLDLTYITTNLICMAVPAPDKLVTRTATGEAMYLNNAVMMNAFLAAKHYNKFLAFNLCAEEIGNYSIKYFFDQVRRIPTEEKSPPAFMDLLAFCENAANYLKFDESKVVIVHCDSGQDRSGVFVSAFLLYSRCCLSASDAINFFKTRRVIDAQQSNSQAVGSASMKRAVSNIELSLDRSNIMERTILRFDPVQLVLSGIQVQGFKVSGLRIKIVCSGLVLFDSSDSGVKINTAGVSLPSLIINGDTHISVFSDDRWGGKKMMPDFFCHFHTAFVDHDPSRCSKVLNMNGQRTLEFERTDMDFVGGHEQDFPQELKMVLSFAGDEPRDIKMLNAFRSTITTTGEVKSYQFGEVVLRKGSLVPAVRMILHGNISHYVAKRSNIGHGKRLNEVDDSNVGIYGRGQIFGYFSLCAGMPDGKYVCTSSSCKVVELSVKNIIGEQDAQKWIFPGVKEEELPGFFKVLSQILCQESLSAQMKQIFNSKEAAFDMERDHLYENLRNSAIKLLKLPSNEECLYVQRCEVFELEGYPCADRIVFLTNYIILDDRMRGNNLRTEMNKVFDNDELSGVRMGYPDDSKIFFAISGHEYEVKCGSSGFARTLFSRLNGVMNEKHILFRRLARETRNKSELIHYGDWGTVLRPWLDVVPKRTVFLDETLMEAGAMEQGVLFVASGSLMLLDERRVVKVVRTGQAIGMYEYILNMRTQFTAKPREPNTSIVNIAASLLHESLKKEPSHALRFYQFVARQAATELYLLHIRNAPSEIANLPDDMKAFNDREGSNVVVDKLFVDGDIDLKDLYATSISNNESENEVSLDSDSRAPKKATVKQTGHDPEMMRLLRYRRSEFLAQIDNFGLEILASGMSMIKVSQGEFIIKEGESAGNSIVPNSMYVVKTGILEVFRNGIERGNVVSFLTAGFTAGERALLTKKVYAASVKARTPVVLGVVPIEVVKEVIAGNSNLQTKLKLFFKSKEFDANSSVGKSSPRNSSVASFIEEERILEGKIKHKAKKMEQILKAKEEQDANREQVWRDEGRLSSLLLEVLPALIRDPSTGNLRPPESVFVQFDQDGNGRIDKDEFVKGLKTLGLHLSDKDTDLLWDFLDDDGGGDLDVHEMCSKLKIMHDKAIMNERVEKYVVKLLHLVIPALIRDPRTGDLRPPESVFEMMDEDGNGRVDKDEFVEGLKVCGLDLPAEETDLLWEFLDDDGGGDLDMHEMCSKLMVHYKKQIQDDQEAAAAEGAASEQRKAQSSVFLEAAEGAASEGAASEQRKARSSVFLDSLQSTSEERLLELAHLGNHLGIVPPFLDQWASHDKKGLAIARNDALSAETRPANQRFPPMEDIHERLDVVQHMQAPSELGTERGETRQRLGRASRELETRGSRTMEIEGDVSPIANSRFYSPTAASPATLKDI